MLKWILMSGVNLRVKAIDLLLKMLLIILTPLLFGKSLHHFSTHIQHITKHHKIIIDIIKNTSCITIVWLYLSKSRDLLLNQNFFNLCILILASALIHLLLLLLNYLLMKGLQIGVREVKAVVLMSSQKTFPVALAVVSFMDPVTFGNLGLITIPCVVGHVVQVFIDSFVIAVWHDDH